MPAYSKFPVLISTFILSFVIAGYSQDNMFAMQRWTGAWGSDGPINTGDLNGDSKTDVFMWRNASKTWMVNLSNGNGFAMQEWTGAWGSDGQINTGDLNGDGKTDVFMFRNTSRTWMVNLSTGSGFTMREWTGAWGSDGQINTGDLNGDGKTDVFMWRNTSRTWMINLSTGNGFTMQEWTGAWGSDGQINTGDLNGDRKTDVFMWRNASNTWMINLSNGIGFTMLEWKGAWGSDGPIHIGDLNGDGKTDVFMWRKSDNSWTINLSGGNGFTMHRWVGACEDNNTYRLGDFNGDRKTDIAIWKDDAKTWTLNLSLGNGFTIQSWSGAWGSDGPVNTGDFNGDGRKDIMMWRNADNSWMVNLSKPVELGSIAKSPECAPVEQTGLTELIDISPDTKNGTVTSLSTAGLISYLAGDKNGLYAVSLNAGIWKTEINNEGNFAKWRQLQNSPRYSSCIAVDPQFPGHIAVGEREGDAQNREDEKCGAWESFDGGQTFEASWYYNPSAVCNSSINSRAVTAVAITDKSTTIVASPCGISRREYLGKSFATVLQANITAISNYQDLIVARSRNQIFISADDGKTWPEQYTIQTSFGNSNFILDGSPVAMINEGLYSIAIIRPDANGNAFVYLPATRSVNDPNMASVLIFNRNTKTWSFQSFQPGLGTGLGGRAFIKSYYLNVNSLTTGIGGNAQLIFSAAQDLLKAKRINLDGTVEWDLFAISDGSGSSPRKFHSDICDFHIDAVGWYVWVANDGGVYYQTLNRIDKNRLKNLNKDNDWATLNEGLHTHHIHALAVGNSPPRGEIYDNEVYKNASKLDAISYSTSDNHAWKNGLMDGTPVSPLHWKVIGGMGDVNLSFMDNRNAYLTLNVRSFNNRSGSLDDFGSYTPAGSVTGLVNICQDVTTDGQQGLQIIQSLKNESVPEYLDVLMLVNLPVKYGDGLIVSGALGVTNPNGSPAIIRNRNFAKQPSTAKLNPTGWEILFNNLPQGASGFWVSGGHQDPTIYVLGKENNTSRIFRRKSTESTWTAMPFTPSPILGLSQYGPLFVNPYELDVMYVVCEDGIYFFDKGQNKFIRENELTNAISGNGKYPVGNSFNGGKGGLGFDVILGNRSTWMCPLSSMAFNVNDPKQIACSSPFTGVFYKNGNAPWKDYSYLLPKPFTPISSVGLTANGIYIATEGRGILLIKNP